MDNGVLDSIFDKGFSWKDEMENLKSENTEITKEKSLGSKIFDFFTGNLLFISVLFFVTFGALVPVPGAFLDHPETVYVCVIGIFFINGLYLRTSELKEVVTSYKAAIYGIVAILGLTPIINSQLLNLLEFGALKMNSTAFVSHNETLDSTEGLSLDGIGPVEFKLGITLFFCMPCTISSGIVMVSSLNGHVALAIFFAVFTNTLGIFTTPLYVKWLIASDVHVDIDLPALILRLTVTLFIPLMVGKTMRSNKRFRKCVTEGRPVAKIFTILFLSILIWTKVSRTSLNGLIGLLTVYNALFIVGWVLLIHGLYLCLNAVVGWLLKLPIDLKKTIVIMCSQKTLAVAISITSFLPDELGDKGMMVVVMIICLIVIFVVDSLIVSAWVTYDRKKEVERVLSNVKEKMVKDRSANV